jgi:hypothetical protein
MVSATRGLSNTPRYFAEGTEPQSPAPFLVFPKEVRDEINVSLETFITKTTVTSQDIEPLLRSQIEAEILPSFESALIESLGVKDFRELVSYGQKLLQSTSQLRARSIPPPNFFEILRGSISKQYKPLRNQVVSWLDLKAFIAGDYWPASNLNILTWAKAARRELKIPVHAPCPVCATGDFAFALSSKTAFT